MITIGFSGHRNLINPEEVAKDIAYSLKYFREIDKDLLAISALASGADTLFAEEAKKLSIPLKIILPFELEEYEKDFEERDLQKFQNILNGNDFEILNKLTSKTDKERNLAYLNTGKKIVDKSDLILAVWNGKAASGSGGTGDIIEYARSGKKELHIINAIREYSTLTFESDDADAVFKRLDNEAIKYKKRRFEPAWIAGIISGILAVISFALVLVFVLNPLVKIICAVGEVLFLVFSIFFLAVRARKWKNIFLSKRRGAEYLRTLIWYKLAGIPISLLDNTDYDPGSEIKEVEKKMSMDFSKIDNIPNAKRMVWCLAEEQIDYHQKKRVSFFTKKLKNIDKWLTLIKMVFFCVVALNICREAMEFNKINSVGWIIISKPFLFFLWIILPPFYAALEGIKYFGEWKRNIALSKKIARDLQNEKLRILDCKTEEALICETKSLRFILEIENSDWAIRYNEKEVGANL